MSSRTSQPSGEQANPAPLQELKGTHILPQSCLYDVLEGLCRCPHTACSMAWSSLGHSRWKGHGGAGTVSADSEREEEGQFIIQVRIGHFWVKGEKDTESLDQ